MKKIYVVAHTHWDYEWYFTENESSIQLVYHIRELIKAFETEKLDSYMLDGQSVLLDIIQEYDPPSFQKLSTLIRNGQVDIGPWYTQTDQFLVKLESIYQNLKIGINKAKMLKPNSQFIGYVPDAFGQNDQILELYRYFEIDKLLFWRGLAPTQSTNALLKYTKDQTALHAINLRFGYYYGYVLYDQVELANYLQKYEATFTDEPIILPVGGDQRAIDFELHTKVKEFNRQNNDYQMEIVNYWQLFEQMQQFANKTSQQLANVKGELLNGAYSKIHRSIYSTRVDLKQLNDRVENNLIFQTTPLMLMADAVGFDYQFQLLEKMWCLLLKNHAHDSICGCNSDQTNKQIQSRLEKVLELSVGTNDYLIRKLAEATGTEHEILVANTLAYPRSEKFKLEIMTKKPYFEIFTVDKDNCRETPIEFEVVEQKREYTGTITTSVHDPDLFYYHTTVNVKLELAKFSFSWLKIVESSTAISRQSIVNNETNSNVNFLLEKLVLTIEDDAGDGYDFSYNKPHRKQEYCLIDFDLVELKSNLQRPINTLKVSKTINWYNNLTDNECERKLEVFVECSQKELAWELNVEIINHDASDFRIQLSYIEALTTATHQVAGVTNVVRRPNIDPNIANWKQENWCEEPSSIYPLNGFIILNDKTEKAEVDVLFVKGLKEYEVSNNRFAITLLRSVSFLGRPNLSRRPGKASGQEYKWVPTPDNKMQGNYTFELMYKQNVSSSELYKESQKFENDVIYYQIQAYNLFTGPLKYFQSNKATGINLRQNYLSELKLPAELIIHGIDFEDETKQVLKLRVFNPTNNQVKFIEQIIESDQLKIIELKKGEVK